MAPVVVVGAGAAGLMAAIFAARGGCRVLLLERTRDGGRKILISGGGRCNILPVELEPARFVTASSPNLLRRLLTSWALAGQRRFFEVDAGVPLKLEADGKLFPVSNSARHVRDALGALALQAGVETRFEALVTGLEPGGDGTWEVGLAGGAPPVLAARVILASGGLSVPRTGSDGTGLDIARRLGHTINSTYPALTPLLSGDPRHGALAGVSLRAAIDASGATRARSEGGFLFTHRGYSGPSVLDVSHVAVRAFLDPEPGARPARIVVRWSALDREAWDGQLQRPARRIGTLLREHLPARLAVALMEEVGLAPDSNTSDLRRESRLALIERLTRYALPCSGHEGYAKAEVTGGGVALADVHPATLESRLAPGLHLCGEMLDAFGPIGGHNFAWAWATGRLAGLGAAGASGR